MNADVLFDAEFLGTLEQLRVASSRVISGYGRGNRMGRHRGRGIEFADYRPYAQGDDFRHIDWPAYQRLNRLLLRLYDEEQALTVHLLLDSSRSMGEHGKFDRARRVAAALCYIGLAHLDRVSLQPFGDHLGSDLSPGRAKYTILQVFEGLGRLQPSGLTDLWQTVTDLGRRSAPAGLVVVISDFLDPAGYERPLGLLGAMGHEVFAIHIASDIEASDPSLAGELCLVDAETGAQQTIELTPTIVADYQRAETAYAREIAATCGKTGAGYVLVTVEQPFEAAILHTLRSGRLLE